jgi:hypothetical protein
MLLALLLLQTVPGPPSDDPAPAVQACERGGDELVVCARTRSDRLRRLGEPVRGAPMTVRIGPNATVHAEAIGIVRAYIPDNRILAHLKLTF